MRTLLVCALVALAASSASATKYQLTRKWDGTNCRTPISQVGCRIGPNGKVEGVFFGAWGKQPAAFETLVDGGHVDYVVQGPYGYTSNWCAPWGTHGRCVTGTASATDLAKPQPPIPNAVMNSPPSATDFAEWTIPYVTGMKVCYGKKTVKGIAFDWATYNTQWQIATGDVTNPPQAVVTPTGTTGEAVCGSMDDCLYSTQYNAPDGEVLGGFDAKCKYTQGWFKYVQNGDYHSKYFLEKIEKVCTLPPTPPPIGRFTICDECCPGGVCDPNVDTCPDYGTYQCEEPCNDADVKKKL